MPAQMIATYEGELRTVCKHLASGDTITTDAPLDNHGKGEAFSPTDLCCAALSSCSLTIMSLEARKFGKDIVGARTEITKTMASDPRCIAKIEITFHLPGTFTLEERVKLQNAASTCPVCLSLGPATEQILKFSWMD